MSTSDPDPTGRPSAVPAAAERESQPENPAEPEPDGILASRLRQVFDRALSKVIQTSSYENFAQCFPTPAKNAPEQLQQVWQQMNTFFDGSLRREFESVLEERNVIPSLNQLDRLLKEADERRKAAPEGEVPVAPATLPSSAIMSAHLTPLLLNAQEQVTGKIEDVRRANDELITTIEAQRMEIEELVKTLETNMGHMDGAVKEVQDAVGGKALTDELDALDA